MAKRVPSTVEERARQVRKNVAVFFYKKGKTKEELLKLFNLRPSVLENILLEFKDEFVS